MLIHLGISHLMGKSWLPDHAKLSTCQHEWKQLVNPYLFIPNSLLVMLLLLFSRAEDKAAHWQPDCHMQGKTRARGEDRNSVMHAVPTAAADTQTSRLKLEQQPQ